MGPQARPPRRDLTEDATRLMVDFAAGCLFDLLSLALVDRQFHSITKLRFLHEVCWLGAVHLLGPRSPADSRTTAKGVAQLLHAPTAQQFVSLSSLPLVSPGVTCTDDDAPVGGLLAPFSERESLLHCASCSTPILKADDIISSNYRLMTGKAYFSRAAHNVRIADEATEANYTSGRYIIRNVCCAQCSARVGVTFTEALDAQNRFKEGKFLLSQQSFTRLACCSRSKKKSPQDLPMRFCPMCQKVSARSVLQLVYLITNGFDVCLVRRLYDQLCSQRMLEAAASSHPLSKAQLLVAPQAMSACCMSNSESARDEGEFFSIRRGVGVSSSSSSRSSRRHTRGSDGAVIARACDAWQNALLARFELLASVPVGSLADEHLDILLSSIVRFAGLVHVLSKALAPVGSSAPDKLTLLFRSLPGLLSQGASWNSLRVARALALAVHSEWCGSPAALSASVSSAASANDGFDANLSACEIRLVAETIAMHALNPVPTGSAGRRKRQDEDGGTISPSDTSSSASSTGDFVDFVCVSCKTRVVTAEDVVQHCTLVTGLAGQSVAARDASCVVIADEVRDSVSRTAPCAIRDVSCSRCCAPLGYFVERSSAAEGDAGKAVKFEFHREAVAPHKRDQAVKADLNALKGELLELLVHGVHASSAQETDAQAEMPPQRLLDTVRRCVRDMFSIPGAVGDTTRLPALAPLFLTPRA